MNKPTKSFTLKLFLSLYLFFQATGLQAQSYGNALGIRVANSTNYRTVGLTFQQRLLKHVTIEGIAQTDFAHNSTFHALVEYHHPILTKRLNYYMGAGLNTGIEANFIKDKAANTVTTTYGNTVFGTDLVAGIEMTLLKYNISIDYKPNFNLVGRNTWYQGQVGISARAVILSGAEIDKKRRQKTREKRQKTRKEKWADSPLKQFFEKEVNY